MNPHRKGNAFDANAPGDPRLHDAISRRTPMPAGMTVTRTHGGVTFTPKKKPSPSLKPLMWKVTKIGDTEEEEPKPKFRAKGGILVTQGTRVEVADVGELEATEDSGFICLLVVRNSSSRAYVSSSIVWRDGPDAPESDYAGEYTVLAEYSESTGVVQCRNDEICSHELMIVENGEFALLPFQTNSRNTYDPPAP